MAKCIQCDDEFVAASDSRICGECHDMNDAENDRLLEEQERVDFCETDEAYGHYDYEYLLDGPYGDGDY